LSFHQYPYPPPPPELVLPPPAAVPPVALVPVAVALLELALPDVAAEVVGVAELVELSLPPQAASPAASADAHMPARIKRFMRLTSSPLPWVPHVRASPDLAVLRR
jgi:hypothetical protein